jgi:phosphate transport system permease protein
MSSRSLARRKISQGIAFAVIRLSMLTVVGALGGIVLLLVVQGIGAVNWTFLSDVPRDSMTKGGIFPAIAGTVLLTLGALLTALPLGVASAVYLSEYATQGRLLTLVRLGIQNLAGVPSVVFGLFGLALFVIHFRMGVSLAAGSLTLGLLILPTVIGASEEALRGVPAMFREASLSLGATRWQTIRKVVLPAALPGILTGSILGIGRAAGETAPIMFTAATFYTLQLPGSPWQEVMALPYHIYVLATAGTHIDQTRPLQFGTVLVLITLVLGMSLTAIVIRSRIRKGKKW